MLNVACVRVGTAYDAAYVNRLFNGVRSHLHMPMRFVCFTNDPDQLDAGIAVRSVPPDLAARGWWAKLFLFSDEAFPAGDRVLYLDLDTIITGPLDEIASYRGKFAILRDVNRPGGLQSAVMAWEAGRRKCRELWVHWRASNSPDVDGGDQIWIESNVWRADILQELFPGQLRSYKKECRQEVPLGTSVVFFHGRPRPHEVTSGWVPETWTQARPGAGD